MDDLISRLLKIFSNTIIVHIYSYPHFSIEIFLASVICVVHWLLILEVNKLYKRSNLKAAAKLRSRSLALKEVATCSYQSISRIHTQIFPQKIRTTATRQSYYVPSSLKRLSQQRRQVLSSNSNRSNFGAWVLPSSPDTTLMLQNSFNNRVERLLSISPSEYVRKDKERKSREEGLRSCIQSLTNLLEMALSSEGGLDRNLSRETIKKSINAIRENFENHMSGDEYQLAQLKNSSLQSLINQATMRKSLMPIHNNLLGIRVSSSYNNQVENIPKNEYRSKDSHVEFKDNRSLDSMQNYFSDKTIEVLHEQHTITSRSRR